MMRKIENVSKWMKDELEEAEKQAAARAQSDSQKMVNLLNVADEESLHLGIDE